MVLQRLGLAGRRRVFAQLQFGFDGADGFVAGAVGPHQLQGGSGALEIAALEIAGGQARHRPGMARLVLQHMAIGLGGGADIAGRQGLVGDRQHFGGMFRAAMIMAVPPPPPASWATKALIWLSGMAPMKPSTGWPSWKA